MKKRAILFFAVILYGMVWAQNPAPDLQLGIGSQGGQIQITGSVATNLDYLLLCSSNLTEWAIAADLTSLSGDSFDYVETNRSSCLFYKRICSRVNGTSFVTTENPSAPVAAVMADGSMIAVLVDSNDASRVTGSIYTTTNGGSVLMELGTNGMPRTITSADSIFYFRDWTQNTVDVWWIQTNGTRQVFEDVRFREDQATAEPLAISLKTLSEPLDSEEVGVSTASEVQEWLDIVLIGWDVGSCAISVATVGISGGATVPVAILSCSAAASGLAELMFDEPWAGGAGAMFSLASAVANPEVVFIDSMIASLEAGNASLGILLDMRKEAEPAIAEIDSACQCPLGADPAAVTWEVVNDRWVKNSYANGNVTMSDRINGLMWIYNMGGSLPQSAWEDAVTYCDNLSYAGYSDWGLPSREYLITLDEYDAGIEASYGLFDGFSGVGGNDLMYFWGEEMSDFPASAYYVAFSGAVDGTVRGSFPKTISGLYAWPVRQLE